MNMQHVYMPRELPESLQPMIELALDLRWTSTRGADRFWTAVDAETWRQTSSGWLILQNISDERLSELAADSNFRKLLGEAIAARERNLSEAKWFAQNGAGKVQGIAYFSMEFGLSEALPIYSGGLGLLAGDYLKSANDLGLPVTGVGLLYQEGYFRQVLTSDGWQQEVYPYNNPSGLPVQPLVTDQGWLRVQVELPGRALKLRVWKARVGNVTLLLLDSDGPMNSPADCGITGKLYGGNQEMRIQQEIVLGIGGWRALEALGIETEICHLNEGHAAFVVLERARSFMQKHNTTFWEALFATRPGNIFTTHTAVAAGFDRFEPALLYKYLWPFLAGMKEQAPAMEDVLALGRETGWNPSEPLNMAYLALRGCGFANGVSQLHGEVSRSLFQNLYPRWPLAEVPVTSVTNGVHVPSWISDSAEHLLAGVEVETIPDEELFAIRNQERAKLVEFARARLERQLGQRGAESRQLTEASEILDPNILTLGFARRFAAYKRPNLLLWDSDRLERLLKNSARPVQIIIAGKAHPADEGGKHFIQTWVQWIQSHGVRNRAVFLEDYDIERAGHLAAGVDVWINNPRRPWEASGTSGMKLLANGGLNVSELDGWWVEAYNSEVGWAIGDGRIHPEGSEDAAEADQLYRILEEQVVPKFYDRDEHGVPRAWLRQVRASMQRLVGRFSSDRMCREYAEKLYIPAAPLYRKRTANGGEAGRDLLKWKSDIDRHWHEIRFGDFIAQQEGDQQRFRVQVYHGNIDPGEVRVELYANPVGGEPPFRQAMARAEQVDHTPDGFWYETTAPAGRNAHDFTPRAMPANTEALIPMEDVSIRWRG